MYQARSHLLALIFLVGFSSLVYEIYSVRVLFMFFAKSTQAVSIAISSFLAGIAISSLLFSRLSHSNQQSLTLILLLQLAAAIYGYFVLSHYQMIPGLVDGLNESGFSETSIEILKVSMIWLFLFMPAFFMGGAFPLVNGLYIDSLEHTSKDTGVVYFWDTLGAILGAMLAGFVFIPKLGLEITLLVPVIINLCCCLLVCGRKKQEYALVTIILILVTFETLRWSNMDIGIDLRSQQEKLNARYGEILFHKESPFGQVVVTQKHKDKELYIDYRFMCQSYQDNIAEFPLTMVPKNADILSIGFGCGYTSSLLGHHAKTAHMDVVEVNPVVIEAANLHFRQESESILEQDHVELYIQDGYEFTRNSRRRYDAIIVDIEAPTAIYSSAFFTKEFLEAAKGKLKPGGVLALWTFESNKTFTKILYNTFKEVFPHVIIRNYGSYNHFYAMDAPHELLRGHASKDYMQHIRNESTNLTNTIAKPFAEQYYDAESVFHVTAQFKRDFDALLED